MLERIEEVGKKWSQVAKKLPGRTENAIKNRFNSLIRTEKRKYFEENKNVEELNFSSALNAVFDTSAQEEKLDQFLFKSLLERLRKSNNIRKLKTIDITPELKSESFTSSGTSTCAVQF